MCWNARRPRQRGHLLGPLAAVALVAMAAPVFAAPGTAHAPAGAPSEPGPTQIDDVPEKLIPANPRTEADRDRLEALALFATARQREHRMDEAGALRLYQRAFRCDPNALSVAQAIVPLAYRLKRFDEAVRYALKMAELEQADPLLLRALARRLVETGDLDRAVTLYEKAVAARRGEKPGAADVLMWMELGQFYHIVDQDKKAAEQFSRVLDALDHPEKYDLDDKAKQALLADPGATFQAVGESFLAAERWDAALAAFERSHKLAPNQGLLAFNRARVLAKTGKPAEALDALQACFDARLSTEADAPYELLADVLKALGRQGELLARLEKLHAADKDNVPLAYFLAGKHREAGQLDKAEAIFAAALQKAPTRDGYRAALDIYRKTNRPDKLLDLLAQLANKTSSLEVLGAEGKAVLADAGLVGRVIGAARDRLKKEDPGLPYEARLAVALLGMECKRFDVAEEFYNLALKSKPNKAGELLLLWGAGLLMEERPAEAARVFQRGIDEKALPEGNPAFYFYLAGALELSGKTDEALAAARKAAELKPDSARFAGRAAWVYFHAKRRAEAEKAYRELLTKFDANYDSAENRQVMRDTRLVLSSICVLDGRVAEGEEWLEQVLDEFPDDIGALNDLGYLWIDAGKRLERALRMVRQAVEGDPENPAYLDSLGWAYFRLGRFQEAVAELQKAAAGKDPDAEVLDHLGDACAAAGLHDKARDAWTRAAEAFRKEGEAAKAKKVEDKLKKK